RAKFMAWSMARFEGATTVTSPVEGCTLTIRRRARGLSLSVTATGSPSIRNNSRLASCERLPSLVFDADVTLLPMDFSLRTEPALFTRKHDRTGMSSRPRFHLAFPVRDLAEARGFYGELLGCREGRSSDEWVDFDFFGHQIVAHLSPSEISGKAHNW